MTQRLVPAVCATIRDRGLFRSGERVLVAVSGGADSVALLHALHELAGQMRIRLAVAHLNHAIRGKDADRDAAFVAGLARELKLPFVMEKRNVPRLAAEKGISLEMAAREARYSFFAEAAAKSGAGCVATAHTADDQAETIILRLTRGAGSRGLGGIRYKTPIGGVKVVRPLLDAGRGDVLAFLRGGNIQWREDKSNTSMEFSRNRVRHEVLPFLETKLGPGVKDALLRAADVLRAEDEWMEAGAAAIATACSVGAPAGGISAGRLAGEPLAARRRVLRAWLSANGVPPELLDFDSIERAGRLVRGGDRTAAAQLSGGWRVRRAGGSLLVERGEQKKSRPFRAAVRVPGETAVRSQGLRIVTTIRPGIIRQRPQGPGHLPARASLNLSSLKRRKLTVRSWRPGDRVRPLGLEGSKKVQDIFVDGKVPPSERGRVPIFDCGGEIVWIPGYRVAKGWEVSDRTAPAIRVEVARL